MAEPATTLDFLTPPGAAERLPRCCPQHPDWATNMDTTNVSQDQVSATWAHANAGVLAPLAKRCIDRVSWRRIRPLRVRPAYGSAFPPRHMNIISAVMDDNDPRWQSGGTG